MARKKLLEKEFVIDGERLLVEIFPTVINITKVENQKTVAKK